MVWHSQSRCRLIRVGLIAAAAAGAPAGRSSATGPDAPPSWRSSAVRLSVHTEPDGCLVKINTCLLVDGSDRPLRTPLTGIEVPPGMYRVEVVHEGYATARRWVRLAAPSAALRFTLDRADDTAVPMPVPVATTAGESTFLSLPRYRSNSADPVPPYATERERLSALAELTGRNAKWRVAADGNQASVHADFSFDDPADGKAFAALMGRWSVDDGMLRAKATYPPQVIWAIPLATAPCSVAGTVRSTGVFELNLHDPFAARLAGTSAVARIHFGRTREWSEEAWVELSSGGHTLAYRHGFRLADGSHHVALDISPCQVQGRLSPLFDGTDLKGRLTADPVPAHVYVGVAGAVGNEVNVHALHIAGTVDLYSDGIDALVGIGEAFWGDGRRVTLWFSGDGCFQSLRHNGAIIAARSPTDPLAGTLDPPLRCCVLTLRAGDVLVFELSEAEDFAALRVTGVDDATRRTVLASSPLTWAAASGRPSTGWLTAATTGQDVPARVSRGQAPALRDKFRAATGRDWPVLPLTGPPDARGHAWLKYVVR